MKFLKIIGIGLKYLKYISCYKKGLDSVFKNKKRLIIMCPGPSVMEKIKDLATQKAESLGITVIDVRINKIALPQATLNRVYNNMRTEFSTQATKIRADGLKQAEAIRADSDKQKTIILATAKEQAAKTIAEGQAQSAQIYADAYQNDPKFYQFYRSLEAYQNVFKTKDDTIVLHPKGEFFKYFNTPLMNGVSK